MKKELFRSYFLFDETVLSYMQAKKSIAQYPGPFFLDEIIIDIDKGKQTDDYVHSRAIACIYDLMNDWKLDESHIKPYYSGSGYHIHIPEIFGFGGITNPNIVKHTLNKHFHGIDDLFYNTSLIRVAGTINRKTNRYKTPFKCSEIINMSTQDIIKMSETVRDFEYDTSEEPVPNHSSKIVHEQERVLTVNSQEFKSSEAGRMVTCIQKMYNQGPIPGSRHNVIMRITSAFRRAGVPKSAIIGMIQQWERTIPPAEVSKYVSDVFDKGYKYGCHDPLMSQFCDSNCQFFHKKNYLLETKDTKSMMRSYVDYLTKLKHENVLNLNSIYRMDKDFKFLPGEFVVVWGDAKIGKTAWVQNIVTAFKVKTLYISLEVHEALLFRRFVQIASNLDKDAVDAAFSSDNEGVIENLSNRVSHINVVTIPPTLHSVEKMIMENNPQITVIDTLDGLDVPAKTETEKTVIIANELKRIANSTNSIIIGIHHISKSAAEDERGMKRRLTIHSGKGSSGIEQKADKVIGIEAEGDPTTNPIRFVSALASRDEAPFKMMKFTFDWSTFRYRQKE